jgi:hypothetical protein
MRVSYKPQTRYLCDALTHTYARPTCQNLDGRCIEEAVVAAFFEALQPAELDLLEEVVAAQQADHARVAQHLAEQVRRAEYEARLAQRQYDAIDPDNRLVAAELERRWELARRARWSSATPPSPRSRRSIPGSPNNCAIGDATCPSCGRVGA